MTVRELMAALAGCDMDMVVRMPDTYWQSEGYGERADDLDACMPVVSEASVRDGYVELCADCYEEDEEEEDEEEEEMW